MLIDVATLALMVVPAAIVKLPPPKAAALPNERVPLVRLTVPTKAVLAPLRIRDEVVLFSVTLVTPEPRAPLIVVAPVVVPLFVIEPVVLIATALKATVEEPVPEKEILPLLATAEPLSARLLAPVSLMAVTLVPIGALIVVEPVPVPAIVMVPTLSTLPVLFPERVTPPAMEVLLSRIRLPEPPTTFPALEELDTVSFAVPLVLLLVRVVPPLLTVRAVVAALAALMERDEVALFSVMPVTLEPTPLVILAVPVPVPELVMVPALATLPVEMVIAPPVLLSLIVRFPVPVMPPVTVVVPVPVAAMVRLSPPSATAPLNMAVVVPPSLPIVRVPAALEPKLIALAMVTELASKLAEPPEELPREMGALVVVEPAAEALLRRTIPCWTVKPPL